MFSEQQSQCQTNKVSLAGEDSFISTKVTMKLPVLNEYIYRDETFLSCSFRTRKQHLERNFSLTRSSKLVHNLENGMVLPGLQSFAGNNYKGQVLTNCSFLPLSFPNSHGRKITLQTTGRMSPALVIEVQERAEDRRKI